MITYLSTRESHFA